MSSYGARTKDLIRLAASERAALVGFAALAIAYYAWTWSHQLSDFDGDDSLYLLMAQYFSPFADKSAVATFFYRQSPFPPLYPFLLALVDGGDNLLAAHIVTTTFLLAGFIALYWWQREIGITRMQAGVLVAVFALLPGTYFQSLSILSENAYVFLAIFALAAVARAEKTNSDAWYWAACMAVAAACVTRSVGVTLLGAYAMRLWITGRPRWPMFTAIAAVPLLLWSVFHVTGRPTYLDSLLPYFYRPDHLAVIADVVTDMCGALRQGWTTILTSWWYGPWLADAVGIAALSGAAYRAYARKMDGFYVALYGAVILLWPYPAHAQRFIYVLVPVLLVQGWLLVCRIARTVHRPRVKNWAFALFLSASFGPALLALIVVGGRFAYPIPPDLRDYAHTFDRYRPRSAELAVFEVALRKSLIWNMRHLQESVPSDACVYSVRPSLVSFYSRRISIVTPQSYLDDAQFYEALRQSACKLFFLTYLKTPSHLSLYYPSERMRGRLVVLRNFYMTPGDPKTPVIAMLAEQKRTDR